MHYISRLFILYPIVGRLLAFIAAPIFIMVVVLLNYLKWSLPIEGGDIYIHGLNESVIVKKNEFSFPFISAKNDQDAFFALGYMHAQDRLWQMEVSRRIASGRLSEVIGASGVNSDKYMRTLGLFKDTFTVWEKLEPSTKQLIQAYVNGVNASIEHYKVLPPEFLYYNLTMEKWSAYDSLVIFESMAWMMSANYHSEIKRASLIDIFGINKALDLMPEVSKIDLSLIQTAMSNAHLPRENNISIVNHVSSSWLANKSYAGSNNWAISGKHSVSGSPLIASDPHLQMSAPSAWYIASMKGESINISGATFPGFPFVILGHNNKIGWGITNMGADVQDVRLERIDPNNKEKYIKDGELKSFIVRKEYIKVKHDFLKRDIDPIPLSIRETNNGFVLSDVTDDGSIYSITWVGKVGLAGSVDSFRKINYAKNWIDFRDALRNYIAPAQNFIYADTLGNIGYIGAGLIPIRKQGTGALPVPGWSSDFDWKGWIPFDALPQSYNPEAGVIVTANNKIVGEDYPYHITNDWAPSFRANRIKEIINKKLVAGEKLSPNDFRLMQGDTVSLGAKTLLPYLLNIDTDEYDVHNALQYLRNWDGNVSADSIAASIFEVWIKSFNRIILEDEVDVRVLNQTNKIIMNDLIQNPDYSFLLKVLNGEYSGWCDYKATSNIESCKDILLLSFKATIAELGRISGHNQNEWRWGTIHNTHYPHFPFSKADFSPFYPYTKNDFMHFLIHKKIGSGGDENTINVAPASGENTNRKFQQFWGASYREVLDLHDLNSSLFLVSPGQSGNYFSNHYSDLLFSQSSLSMISLKDKEHWNNMITLKPASYENDAR